MRGSRGHSDGVDVAKLAAWEADAFPALRRIRDRAKSTPVDDALPEDPQDHVDETRSALELIGDA